MSDREIHRQKGNAAAAFRRATSTAWNCILTTITTLASILILWMLVVWSMGFVFALADVGLWARQPRETRKRVLLRAILFLLFVEAAVLLVLLPLFGRFLRPSTNGALPLLLFMLTGAWVSAYAARAREPAAQLLAALAGAAWAIMLVLVIALVVGLLPHAMPSIWSTTFNMVSLVIGCCSAVMAIVVRPRIPMPTKPWHGPTRTRDIAQSVRLLYPNSEEQTADVLESTCHEAQPVIRELWGFAPPPKLCFCVLTTPARLLFLGLRSASWSRRLLQLVLWPWVYWATVYWWRSAGGYTIQHPTCPVAGIKPPCLLDRADKRIGRRLFEDTQDVRAKLRHAACHEITHAFASRPMMSGWLREGIAEWTVEKFLGRRIVRKDTLNLLRVFKSGGKKFKYKDLSAAETQFLYPYVRGYWTVRYIEENHPGFLKALFCSQGARRLRAKNVEKTVARQLGMTLKKFRQNIDAIVVRHFDRQTLRADDALLPA